MTESESESADLRAQSTATDDEAACLAHYDSIERVFDFLADAGGVTMPDIYPQVAPLCFHGLGQVEAWMRLSRGGMPFAAKANLRVALDHMLRAQWFLWTEDAEIANHNDYLRHEINLLQEGPQTPNTVRTVAELEGMKIGTDYAPKAIVLAKRFGGIYRSFRILSQAVHPSARSQARYRDSGNESTAQDPGTCEIALHCMVNLISPMLYFSRDEDLLARFHQLCAELDVHMDLSSIDIESEKRRSYIVPFAA